MTNPIQLDEWLAELTRNSGPDPNGPEGFAIRDMVAKMGVKEVWARELMRKWIREGKMEYAGKRKDVAIDGRLLWVPVYRVVRK